jgi:hypothetical protein
MLEHRFFNKLLGIRFPMRPATLRAYMGLAFFVWRLRAILTLDIPGRQVLT